MRAVRRAVIARRIAVALAVAGVAGCMPLSPSPTASTTAVLDKMPAGLPRRAASAVTLLVLTPEAKPPYDTTRMAYSLRPHEIAYFRDHQWSATPAQMLQPLLVKTLEGTGYFKAVLTPPQSGHYRYALRTELVELVQDFASEPATLRLGLRLRLSDGATGRLVASDELSLREPMKQKAPYAGVVAANEATAQALSKIAALVVKEAR